MVSEKEITAYCSKLQKMEVRPSCEVLVRDCVTQHERGETRFVLVGPKGQKRSAKDIKACFEASQRIPMQLGALPAARLAPKRAEQPRQTTPASQKAPSASQETEAPRTQPASDSSSLRLLKSFGDVGLRLHVTGGAEREERRVLLFGRGKGLPIRLRYSVRSIEGTARYHMTYTIFRGNRLLSGEQSLEFSASGGRIHLAFEVEPWKEGDFSSLKSIRIVSEK